MFRRKPRYLVDDSGNVRPIYHRESSFFPYLGRFLRRDETNLHAVKINGKWVLAEVDSNEQRKTVEITRVIDRRSHLVKSIFFALLWGGIGYYGLTADWPRSVVGPAARWGASLTADRFFSPIAAYGAHFGMLGLLWLLIFYSYIYTLAVVVAFIKEGLYQLRFPFMRGARTTEMPQVVMPLKMPTAREKYDSDYVDRDEAVRRMRDDFRD